jgi:hypothetical protein
MKPVTGDKGQRKWTDGLMIDFTISYFSILLLLLDKITTYR